MTIFSRIRSWASTVKRDGVTLWFALKHPAVPWHAKAVSAFVVAYALSPIDLIPDFIPVLGYLDELILLPVLIWLVIRMIPLPVLVQCRHQADEWMERNGTRPTSFVGAVAIVALWIAAVWAICHWVIEPRL